MPIQPATRRLVTEQKLTDTAGLYVPLTQRAAANGVATLGADQKVPLAQIPTLSGLPLTAYKAALTSRVNVPAVTADPDLVLTLAVGTYLLESVLWWQVNTTAQNIIFRLAGTATAAQLGTAEIDSTVTSATGPSVNASNSTLLTGNNSAGTSANTVPSRVVVRGAVTVSVAGTLGVQWGTGNTTNSFSVNAGSYLRAYKVA